MPVTWADGPGFTFRAFGAEAQIPHNLSRWRLQSNCISTPEVYAVSVGT